MNKTVMWVIIGIIVLGLAYWFVAGGNKAGGVMEDTSGGDAAVVEGGAEVTVE